MAMIKIIAAECLLCQKIVLYTDVIMLLINSSECLFDEKMNLSITVFAVCFVCVYVCVCVLQMYLCATCAHVCRYVPEVKRQRRMSGVLLCHSMLYFLETESLSEPGTRLVARNSQSSFYFCVLQLWSYRHVLSFLCEYCTFELRSSRMHSKSSWPLSHLLSPIHYS